MSEHVRIERDDLGRDRPGADLRDLPHRLDEVAARLVDEARIGGDSVEQPGVGKLADFGDFGGVGEEFHDAGGLVGNLRKA